MWEKSSDGKFRRIGNQLTLPNIQVKDADFYTCSAKNIIDGDSKRSKIVVRRKLIICNFVAHSGKEFPKHIPSKLLSCWHIRFICIYICKHIHI